ncbi:D-erythro-7,8-dihydroneopterin triphosphate epimerase [Nitrosomonas sp. Nm51]|uniref:dihydroneopterin triphosphate 2'-epimerase n=1 Tax=Nitrosomonas sp. Nm51 TaxID=133720 RepID=UPI0008BC352D|nr:dihydroneopterin triphosphate 2'-epimerase [Nitrosomonas sp. Nm51]SER53347.1 D-erythro-7,8-dihydroneopterin triphosphate epimerase [Nitrosomonas sp. Nm51]
MAIIRIKNLLLRTYIGFNEEEINKLQDVIINATIEVDLNQAIVHDSVDHSYNYKTVTKNIIALVQAHQFKMLEKLTQSILDEIMKNKNVRFARVEVDKPHALRFAESVSVELETRRDRPAEIS